VVTTLAETALCLWLNTVAAGTAGTTVKPVIKLGGPRKGIIRVTTKQIKSRLGIMGPLDGWGIYNFTTC